MRSSDVGLAAVVFLSAAAALMLEIIAGRLVAPYVGMSLYSWTAVIGVVLAGMSLGHLLGGLLAGHGVDAVRGRLRLAAALAAAAVTSLAVLLLLRILAQAVLGRGLSPLAEIAALAFGPFFLPSLCAGIVSPLATKLAVDAAPGRAGPVIGRMFALGALGSIAGTLLTGFVLIGWLGSTSSVLVVAGLYAAMALALALAAGRIRAAAAVAVAMTVTGAAMVWGGAAWRPLTSPCTVESAFYCLRVDDMAPLTGRTSAVLVIDHLAHGINDREQPGLLYSPYLALADELVRRRFGGRALRAFFIGGGAYTLPRAWQRPGARLLVSEIDPEVTRTAMDRLWLRPQPSLEIVHRDARVTLAHLPADPRFDVIFGDAFQDVTVPAHLMTREFHHAVAGHLAADGLYLINLIDAFPRPGLLPSLVRTLERDFVEVGVWLDEEAIATGGRVTYLVVAAFQAPGIRADGGRSVHRARLAPSHRRRTDRTHARRPADRRLRPGRPAHESGHPGRRPGGGVKRMRRPGVLTGLLLAARPPAWRAAPPSTSAVRPCPRRSHSYLIDRHATGMAAAVAKRKPKGGIMAVARAATLGALALMLWVDGLQAGETQVTESGVTFTIRDGREVDTPLTAGGGDPANGAKVVAGRKLGNCLACHVISTLDGEPFQGNVGPPLDGVGDRYGPAELRLQVINSKVINPDSVMPAFFRTAGLVGVREDFAGKTMLSPQEVEDVVAFLSGLKG